MDNPYETPQKSSSAAKERSQLKESILAWEKLRILYNILLIPPGILICVQAFKLPQQPLLVIMFEALFVGFAANICFCAGPMFEIYRLALTQRPSSKLLRNILFGLGLAFSFLVFAFVFIVTMFVTPVAPMGP